MCSPQLQGEGLVRLERGLTEELVPAFTPHVGVGGGVHADPLFSAVVCSQMD